MYKFTDILASVSPILSDRTGLLIIDFCIYVFLHNNTSDRVIVKSIQGHTFLVQENEYSLVKIFIRAYIIFIKNSGSVTLYSYYDYRIDTEKTWPP